MSQDSDQMMANVNQCFDELKPTLEEFARLISDAPLDKAERVGLSILVATYTCGIVAGTLGQEPHECASQVADLIRDQIMKQKH